MATKTTQTEWIALSAHLKKEIPDIGKVSEEVVDQEEFGKFCSLVQSRATLGLASKFLKTLETPEEKFNPRVLLTACMIQRFPKELLEEINLHDGSSVTETQENTNQLDKECFDQACELVDFLLAVKEDTSDEETQKLSELLSKFHKTFAAWKDLDRQKMISVLCNKYTQYEQSIRFTRQNSTDKTPTELNTQLVASQNTTKAQIVRMAGNEFFQEFVEGLNATLEQIEQQEEQVIQQRAQQNAENVENAQNDETENDEKTNEDDEKPQPKQIDLSKIIMECASEKYWKDFENELSSGKFDRVILLITEISNRIKNLTPSRPTLHQRLDMRLNIDLIKQQIHFQALNGEDFLKVFETLWDHLAMLQAPEDDEAWQQWKEEQMKLFSTENTSWSAILPQLFNAFLMKLDKIEDMAAKLKKHIADEQAKKNANN